jgi:hypothetical protein
MIFIVGKQLGLSAGLEDIATTTWNQLARVRIRLPSRSLGEGWCFVIRLYVPRGKPAISKQ